jgi:hypothetical protein
VDDIVEAINTPWVLWLVAASTVTYTLLRQAAETSEWVARALGPIGRRWTAAREARHKAANLVTEMQEQLDSQERELAALRSRPPDAWSADLRRQVDALSAAVDGLRRRNQTTDAYLLYDEKWHRALNLATVDADPPTPKHMSFLEFEDSWGGSAPDGRE